MTLKQAAPVTEQKAVGLPSVSVVVATYKRDELLRACLASVLEQDAIEQVREIVVVDDAQSPSVEPVIAEIQERYPETAIVLLKGRSAGPAAARNIGWRHATGEVIAFIDDDARAASREWLRNGLRHFVGPGIAAVSGSVRVPFEGRPTDFQRNVQQLEQGVFLTCNAFYRRSMLETVGGFDERFGVPFREDADLYYRVEAAGGRTIREPEAVVIHPAPRGRFGVSARLQRYSMYNALLYKKHPERYRREIQSWPPFGYYLMVLLFSGGMFAAISRRRRAAAGLILGWAALDLRFFVKRLRGTSHATRDIADMALTSIVIPPLSVYWRLRGAVRFRTWFV